MNTWFYVAFFGMESHENHSDFLFKFIPVLKNLLTKFYRAYDNLVKKLSGI